MDAATQPRIYVLYHRDCIDGAAAKYAAWKKWGRESGVTYIGVQYDEPLPRIDDGSDVYILDFSYSRKTLVALEKRVNKLVVIDHHKTAAKDLKDLDWARFDMGKSGAVLAWEYFHPDEPVPKIFEYVQDRDLWKFKFPDTKVVTAGLLPLYEHMNSWDTLTTTNETGEYFLDKVKENGKAILMYQDHLVEKIAEDAICIELWGLKCAIISSVPQMRSELGEMLLRNAPDADVAIVAIPQLEKGTVKLSFRSRGDDISYLAERLGGGGHGAACSAFVDFQFFQELIDNEHAAPYRASLLMQLYLYFKRKFF